MSKWIRTVDQRPEDGQEVFAYITYGNASWTAQVYYYKGEWIDTKFNSIIDTDTCAVTHWMAMPEPPVQEAM